MKNLLRNILILTLCFIVLCGVMPEQASADTSASFARGSYADYSVSGWYYVDTIYPDGYTYSYIYDQASSTNGNNLGKVYDGEQVYVYYATTNSHSEVWAYCSYDTVGKTIKGYIHFENLTTEYICTDAEPTQTDLGWYYVDTIYPEGFTYSYIYDQPSSINGNNLGKVKDGEWVYVYSLSESGKWAYCEYSTIGKTIKGYIRFENLRSY